MPAAMPVELPRAMPTEPAVPPPESQSGEIDRAARTVAPRVVDKALIRQYIAGLSKAIQNQLIYPAEARDSATIGSPVIAFTLTETGEILPGTLRIQRGSGFAVLDEAALRAALASAPFARPPERMEIAITVSFAQRE